MMLDEEDGSAPPRDPMGDFPRPSSGGGFIPPPQGEGMASQEGGGIKETLLKILPLLMGGAALFASRKDTRHPGGFAQALAGTGAGLADSMHDRLKKEKEQQHSEEQFMMDQGHTAAKEMAGVDLEELRKSGKVPESVLVQLKDLAHKHWEAILGQAGGKSTGKGLNKNQIRDMVAFWQSVRPMVIGAQEDITKQHEEALKGQMEEERFRKLFSDPATQGMLGGTALAPPPGQEGQPQDPTSLAKKAALAQLLPHMQQALPGGEGQPPLSVPPGAVGSVVGSQERERTAAAHDATRRHIAEVNNMAREHIAQIRNSKASSQDKASRLLAIKQRFISAAAANPLMQEEEKAAFMEQIDDAIRENQGGSAIPPAPKAALKPPPAKKGSKISNYKITEVP